MKSSLYYSWNFSAVLKLCKLKSLYFSICTPSGRDLEARLCSPSTLWSPASSASPSPPGGENYSLHSSILISLLGTSLELETQTFDKIHSTFREIISFSESFLLGQLSLNFSFLFCLYMFIVLTSKITKVIFLL